MFLPACPTKIKTSLSKVRLSRHASFDRMTNFAGPPSMFLVNLNRCWTKARPKKRCRCQSRMVVYTPGLFERTVGYNPGLRPLFCAPKGLQDSAQGFNPGNRPPRATRPHKALPRSALVEKHPSAGLEVLKGRQIERPNKAEAGPMVQLSHLPIARSDFCAAIGGSFIWYPHLSPLQHLRPEERVFFSREH